MTQEEKQLLLKDLCARLPYGVNIYIKYYDLQGDGELASRDVKLTAGNICYCFDNGHWVDFKPYLRPMSSMTDKEIFEFIQISDSILRIGEKKLICILSFKQMDWLNAHHFDYHGLIEKGLALEALPGMYNKEESEEGSDVPVPKTVNEAISTLEKILSDEDREYLLKNGAISMHDSLGRWIRNEWGLWTGSELKNELEKKGLEHPDDMSNYIIEEFIKYLNNKV